MCIFNRMKEKRIFNGTADIHFGCNKLKRLFITHLHGDHIYGLPSVILGISFDQSQEGPISLYGPPGLGEYLSTSFRVCESKIACNLDISELCFPNQTCSRRRMNVIVRQSCLFPTRIIHGSRFTQCIRIPTDSGRVWTRTSAKSQQASFPTT